MTSDGQSATSRPRAPRGSNAYRHCRYWRVGRRVGRTIYAQIRQEPGDHDQLIGMMDTPKLAERVVEAHNALLARELDAKERQRVPRTGNEDGDA